MKLEKGSEPVSRRHPPETFKITIRKARDIDMEDLFQFLHAKGKMTNNCRMGKLFLYFFFSSLIKMNLIMNYNHIYITSNNGNEYHYQSQDFYRTSYYT
jgi:hypothetical protein